MWEFIANLGSIGVLIVLFFMADKIVRFFMPLFPTIGYWGTFGLMLLYLAVASFCEHHISDKHR